MIELDNIEQMIHPTLFQKQTKRMDEPYLARSKLFV